MKTNLKNLKKLSLSRNSLRVLTGPALDAVVGGMPYSHYLCPTFTKK